MPSPQLVSTKEKSPPLRAETISGRSPSASPSQREAVDGDGRPVWIISRPKRSVVPEARLLPEQLSATLTLAPATGAPSSREVTQASDAPRPHLKWTAMS